MTLRETFRTRIRAAATSRSVVVGVAVLSALVNLLYLTGSFFMLEVYDRVLPSRSIPTLVGLSALALILFAFQGLLEVLRARITAAIATAFDEGLRTRVFGLMVQAPLRGTSVGDGLMPMRDLDQVRTFLAGSGPTALFDLPWLPVYVAICFLFHPLIGCAAIGGAIVLIALTLVTEYATRGPSRTVTLHAVQRSALAEAGRRNAEALTAMGMQARFARRWDAASDAYMGAQRTLANLSSGMGAISKIFRMALQSGVLALGAWLVIEGQATSGVMIAASILVARALAPAELAIGNWKGFVAARQSWARLADALARTPVEGTAHRLPAPSQAITLETVCVAPPGTMRLTVQDVGFRLIAGQALGVIGPSASGKSSLVRALVGVWPTARGTVRLDGAALEQWPADLRGAHIGYLPQEAELFAGTVAQNIARFETDTDAAVTAAAQAAGVHELILRLPQGYDTSIGEGGSGLSAGQRQRIGLARALYGNPFLVVLDEPNANLDTEGEHALTQAILGVRARDGICIVVAHRPSALAAVDVMLMLGEGRIQAFGPRDEVLQRVMRPTPVAPAPSTSRPPAQSPTEPSLRESA